MDLIALVADKDMKLSLDGLLQKRRQSLGIREIKYQVYPQYPRDPDTFHTCQEFLRPFLSRSDHALVMLDRHGCGRSADRESLEQEVERRLAQNGWQGRCAAVVIEPELEAWAWSQSPHVLSVLGWKGNREDLNRMLQEEGFLEKGHLKPREPAEAFLHVLRVTRKRRSSSLFHDFAASVTFEGCLDPAFGKLKTTLRRWFPG